MTGAEYKKMRESLSYSQAGLADVLGVTKRTIIRRENGGAPITREAELALMALNAGLEGQCETAK